MPTAKTKKAPKKPPEADDLVRETAGNYVSGDGRFEVRQSDTTWYVVDREQTNEFGQELIHGPFGSLKAAKAGMPGARDVKPLLRSRPRPTKAPDKKEPHKPKPTWIDLLPRDEAAEVRKLIRTLEAEGIENADALARRDRQGLLPAIASTLLERRLAAEIDDLPEKDRALARKLVTRLGGVISAGERVADPLPGWALYEVGPGREPTRRRLRLGG
ncbi:MAG: hypothetical protein WD830_05035 [Chloroflexota bacterium]